MPRLTAGRDAALVEQLKVPNRFVAEIVEVEVLGLVEPWHCLGDPTHLGSGYTERWSSTGPSVDLAHVLRGIEICQPGQAPRRAERFMSNRPSHLSHGRLFRP